jgi:cell filamentation protein
MADPKTEQAEGALTYARIEELDRQPVEGRFDLEHLREVHRRIFQDLPHHVPGIFRPDAPGHIKGRQLEGSGQRYHVHYAPRREVDAKLEATLAGLQGGDAMRGLDPDQFAERMATLYGDLDYLHPFQEGNSRTLRAFTSQLAREAGYELQWGGTNVNAEARDRLYVARDKEVIARAFPGLDRERAMETQSRAEYEAYVQVLARYQEAPELRTLVREATVKAASPETISQADRERAAAAFRDMPAVDAVKAHPELAGAFALLAAIDKKTEAAGFTEAQRGIVRNRAMHNVEQAIVRGEVVTVRMREQVTEPEQGAEVKATDRGAER